MARLKLAHLALARFAHARAQGRISQQFVHRLRQCRRLIRLDQQTGHAITHDVAQATHAGRHNRLAHRHPFDGGRRARVAPDRGHNSKQAALPGLHHRLVRPVIQHHNIGREFLGLQGRFRRLVANNHQRDIGLHQFVGV